jgi:hypothetical protein
MITVRKIAQEGFVVIIDGAESIDDFKTLVQRATNLWPDATPEIKEFADLVTNGIVFQDYKGQDTSPKKTLVSSPENDNYRCLECGCRIPSGHSSDCLYYQSKII